MYFINDVNFIIGFHRSQPDSLPQLPNLIYPAVGCGIDLRYIHRRTTGNSLAHFTLIAGFILLLAPRSLGEVGTIYHFRLNPGGTRLTDPPRTRKQPRMR